MSLTTLEPTAETFLGRFEHVRASLRRSQILLGLAWTVLVAGACLLALTAADFRFELSWNVRLIGFGAMLVAVLATFATQVVAPVRWWSRPRTAAEIERKFPELGQRIRTIVQYGVLTDEAIDEAGIAPQLVDALHDETEERVKPLPLDRVLPRAKLWSVLILAAVPVAALVITAAIHQEGRIAIRRALLGTGAYTTLVIAPGAMTIDQGGSVPVSVEMVGRQRKTAVLLSRPADRPTDPWTSTPMRLKDGVRVKGKTAPRFATLENVRGPLTYRVVAGSIESQPFKIQVRYPLIIRSVEIDLRPPSYSHIAPSVVKGGDVQALAGTLATFRVVFDTPPAEAALVFTDPNVRPRKGEPEPKPLTLPLQPQGKAYTATLTLAQGGLYRVEAKTADNRSVLKNHYRLNVLEDRSPRISFDEPNEALEVHPVAEVRNRVRAGDDIGLSRAGIVFRFNDGEEQTLLLKEFATGPDDKLTSTATLEEMLLVEKLKATQSDSIIYYAFAEDNYPSSPRRTETDLRYLDIRPFKREYQSPESEPGDDNGGESVALNELIARQRFNLNRASRLAHRKANDRTRAEDPLTIATFEETLVGLLRDFMEGFEAIAGERVEPLHQAEESMLASIEALDHGQNAETPNHMAIALRHLIQVRQTFRMLIGRDSAAARAARAFDRTQTQKIRRPKGKDQEAEAIADELEQLAHEEDFVYATLRALAMDTDTPQTPKGSVPSDSPSQSNEPEKKDPATTKSAPKDGSKSSTGETANPEEPDERQAQARREALERQEKLAEQARALEDRLKKLEQISDLAKQRMNEAAEATEKAAGALDRGNTKAGTAAARAGALMLHELARQVKGEIRGEAADELAMARDLADELARREEEFGNSSQGKEDPGKGDQGKGDQGKEDPGKGDQGKGDQEKGSGKGQNEGESKSPSSGTGDGPGWNGWGDWNKLTDEERLQRMEEATRTLEEWLNGAARNAEGNAAERMREALEQNPPREIVARAERVGALYLGGQKESAREEAKALAQTFEALARRLDTVHREMIGPELARLSELNRRAEQLASRLPELRSEAQVAEWRRQAADLARELENSGLNEAAAELSRMLQAKVTNQWHAPGDGAYIVPGPYKQGVNTVITRLQTRMQDLILRDLAAARDEATPPEFRELVDRYYEVLSSDKVPGEPPSSKSNARPNRSRRGMR